MDAQDIVFSANCYISGILSISMSALLLYAILFHTPNEMKNYRIFLLNINISDMLVSSFMTLLQWIPASSKKEIERPANDSGISYVIKGPVVFFIHPHYNHMLTCIFMGLFLYNILSLPSSFAFRYIALAYSHIMNRILTKKFLIPFFISQLFISFCVFLTMYLGDMPKQGVAAQVKSFSEYYQHFTDTNVTSFGNLIHLNFMVYYSVYIIGISIVIGYAILIFSGVQIFRTLKKSKKHLTQKTLEMHRLLALTLACQSCLPLIFVMLPLLTIVISIWTNNYSATVNSIAMLFFSYQVVLSPVFTFIFVKPYRVALFHKIIRVQKLKTIFGAYISTNNTPEMVVPVGQRDSRRNSVHVRHHIRPASPSKIHTIVA